MQEQTWEDGLRTKTKTQEGAKRGKKWRGGVTEKLKCPTLFTVIVSWLRQKGQRGKMIASVEPFVKLKLQHFL